MTQETKSHLIAHVCIFSACAFWGLMAPLGKDAMMHGISQFDLVTFRVIGACLLFWVASLFAPKEKVKGKDKLMFIFAGLFGLVLNQGNYTLGLSITSPINASIVTTSLPIFAMILAAIILREPITGMKAGGVLLGCSGAVILILTSANATSDKVGDIRGDLLCMCAQFSFALYLSLFRNLISKYSVFTINKWMFLWASVMITPFTLSDLMALDWNAVPVTSWVEVGYVVFFGTFLSYIFMMIAQRTLRPTVISVYNYVQPITAVISSLIIGISILQWTQVLAIALVFSGVWLVTKSKARSQIVKQDKG